MARNFESKDPFFPVKQPPVWSSTTYPQHFQCRDTVSTMPPCSLCTWPSQERGSAGAGIFHVSILDGWWLVRVLTLDSTGAGTYNLRYMPASMWLDVYGSIVQDGLVVSISKISPRCAQVFPSSPYLAGWTHMLLAPAQVQWPPSCSSL